MTEATKALPTWDLSDLYDAVDDPRLAADMEAGKGRAVEFATQYKDTIACDDLSAAHLRQALDEYENLYRFIYKPQAFAQLLFATDTQNAERGALVQRAQEFGSSVATHLVFFDLEIGRIPQATYAAIAASPELAPYRHYLDHERELAAHNLSEPEEKILVETSNVRGGAFGRLFTEIHGRAKFRLECDGQVEELTQSQITARLYDPDRAARQQAAASISATMDELGHIGTFIYNTLLHEKDILDRLRGFPGAEASRHLANELDGAVVDTMVQVCVDNFDIGADYYRLKGRLLGLDDLTHYDRYAPISGEESDISFDQARDLVLQSFGGFAPRLAELAEPFFSKGWIDAQLAPGKRGGAFCAGTTPDLHPYVLMNYTGQPRDVMTLAHELGHGVHDVLASRNHLLDYHPVLPLAETASTFGEMLVFDHLRGQLDSNQAKLALLCGKIEDSLATVFRQVAMFRFERQAHQARRQEGELPPERFDQLWQTNMQAMFGEALTLGEEHATWWRYIPHIIQTPFYVYAYAFGELLVLSLYARYQQEGAAFVDKYFELLAAGRSKAPAELVGALGIDLQAREFWQGGCDLIRGRVAEAKELAG
ncbi:MAG: M3 family oligoendopeptidase [Candidatus Latescibacteria bacterium]|nr:M3 family oligoendopeptidase [Candidatus Latescibacterota bacterium]